MGINITIDNKKVLCTPGESILTAARRHGVRIPALCSHEALLPYGACRLCVVEVKYAGTCTITTSCTTAVRDGMRVKTRSAKIDRLRRTLIGLLVSRCPDVPVVQQLVRELGAEIFARAPETDACIKCGQCVRTCKEIVGAEALCFAGKGQARTATVAFYRDSRECLGCGTCVLVCPTGAVRLHDDLGGETPLRVMDTWKTHVPVQCCKKDREPVMPIRLREHVAGRCELTDGFLEHCPICRADARTSQR